MGAWCLRGKGGRSAALAAVLLAPGLALGANILVNPGYETGSLTPWFQLLDYGGATNWTTTSADVHTGAFSATNQGNKLMVQYFAPVPTSLITVASVWVKNPNALFNAIYLEYSDATSGSGLFSTTGQWQYVDFTAWLTPGKSLVAVGMWGYSSGGTDERTYVDDWRVEVIPEPASLLLLAAAALLRRR